MPATNKLQQELLKKLRQLSQGTDSQQNQWIDLIGIFKVKNKKELKKILGSKK